MSQQAYLTSRRPCASCGGPQVRIARRLTDRILYYATLGYLCRSRHQCMQCGREETVGAKTVTPALPPTKKSK